MDYEFFHSLSLEDARAYLNRFLDVEAQAIQEMTKAARQHGLALDYSLGCLADVLAWFLTMVHAKRVPPPPSEPDWIRQAHTDGIVEFDDPSRVTLLRAAYYLGECFVRSHRALYWTTGNPMSMERHMPVVAGFRKRQELAPLMIAENSFSRALDAPKPESVFQAMIEAWVIGLPAVSGNEAAARPKRRIKE